MLTDIWRIENASGLGPYSTSVKDRIPYDYNRHPCPYTVGEEKIRNFRMYFTHIEEYSIDNVVFGFASKYQLCDWFAPDELRIILQNGFDVNIYRVHGNRILHGNKQSVFYKKNGLQPAVKNAITIEDIAGMGEI